jgi:membrane associated rhomboid family serine protease
VIIPIGDQPNPRGTPWVNYALIAANAAVFLLVTLPRMYSLPDPTDPAVQDFLRHLLDRLPPGTDPGEVAAIALRRMSAYDIFLSRWGYRPAEPSVWALLASMFLHGGWLHLLGNMLFLWIYGDNVEHRLGPFGYLAAYLLTGAVAAVVYGFFVPANAGFTPMVGASGAISGVLGFYFVWFPRNKVRLLVLFFPFFVFTWLVSARLVLGFFLIIENLLPFLFSSRGSGGVAYGAHIGGFVAGVIAAVLMNSLQGWRGQRHIRGGAWPRATETDLPSPDTIAQLVDEGDPLEAVPAYLALLPSERARVPAEVVAELGDGLARAGRFDDALAIYRQGLTDHPRGPGLARIFLGIGLVLLHGKKRPAAAYQVLLDSLDAEPGAEVQREARQALAEIERLQKWQLHERRRW